MREQLEHDRVRAHTSPGVNARIDTSTAARLRGYHDASKDRLEERLVVLDREWDIDRAVMATFALLGSATLQAGRRRRGWLWVLQTQLAFLAWHATAGWCPPVAALRRLGFRTTREIEAERAEIRRLLERRETALT